KSECTFYTLRHLGYPANGLKLPHLYMKFRLLYLLTSILIATSLVQCTDSVTGETKNIEASQPIKPDDKSLPAPTQISPDAGADDVSLKPTFKWEAVDGADSYILHV